MYSACEVTSVILDILIVFHKYIYIYIYSVWFNVCPHMWLYRRWLTHLGKYPAQLVDEEL